MPKIDVAFRTEDVNVEANDVLVVQNHISTPNESAIVKAEIGINRASSLQDIMQGLLKAKGEKAVVFENGCKGLKAETEALSDEVHVSQGHYAVVLQNSPLASADMRRDIACLEMPVVHVCTS